VIFYVNVDLAKKSGLLNRGSVGETLPGHLYPSSVKLVIKQERQGGTRPWGDCTYGCWWAERPANV